MRSLLWLAVASILALTACPAPEKKPTPPPVEEKKVEEEKPKPIITTTVYKDLKQHTFMRSPARCFHIHVSKDGKSMAYASTEHYTNAQLYLKDLTTGIPRQITFNAGTNFFPEISPDGRSIAFCSNKDGEWQIYIVSIDNPAMLRQITFGKDNFAPSWSPDGKKLVYCHLTQQGIWELRIVEIETRKITILGAGKFPKWSPHADPASQLIAFQTQTFLPQQKSRILVIRPDASSVAEVISFPDKHALKPSWSPDGKWLVYGVSREEAPPEEDLVWIAQDIYISSDDAQIKYALVDDTTLEWYPVWSGERIYFLSQRDGDKNVFSVAPILQYREESARPTE